MMRLIGVAAVAAAVCCAAACAAAAGTDLRPSVSAERPYVLLWGNGVFVRRSAFEQWLGRHGRAYRRWAALHPAGRLILGHARAELPRFRRSQLAPQRQAPSPLPVAESPPPPASGGDALLLVLAALAAALIALSSMPLVRLAPHSTPAVLLHERRFAVSVIGVGILIGVAVAKLAA
jgi:hypothetical protein